MLYGAGGAVCFYCLGVLALHSGSREPVQGSEDTNIMQVEEVWEPSAADVEKLRLQRDGCAGDIVFLAYSTVHSPACTIWSLVYSTEVIMRLMQRGHGPEVHGLAKACQVKGPSPGMPSAGQGCACGCGSAAQSRAASRCPSCRAQSKEPGCCQGWNRAVGATGCWRRRPPEEVAHHHPQPAI